MIFKRVFRVCTSAISYRNPRETIKRNLDPVHDRIVIEHLFVFVKAEASDYFHVWHPVDAGT